MTTSQDASRQRFSQDCPSHQIEKEHPIQIQSRLTDFEGSLKQNPDNLGNVDAEYEQIVQGLRA